MLRRYWPWMLLIIVFSLPLSAARADDLNFDSAVNGSVSTELWQLIDQINGASGTAKTDLQNQFNAKVAEYQKIRDTLRRAHRSELEAQAALPTDKLLALGEARQKGLTAASELQKSLRSRTDYRREERVAVASQYAALIKARLAALNGRLLALSSKLQTRVSQISDETSREQLSSDLSQLAVTQQTLDSQINQANTSLEALGGSQDPVAAAGQAQKDVKAAAATAQAVLESLKRLVDRLP